jgi:hypothetical protein
MTSRVFLVASVVALAGCAPWRVIQESGPPSALRGANHINVWFDYSMASLGGRPEQAWLATQPPDDQQAYSEVKQNLEDAFLQALASNVAVPVQHIQQPGAAPGGVLCIVRVQKIEQGKYAFVFAMDSELDAHLEWAPGGQPVSDVIGITTTVNADITRPSIIQRMRIAATRLGELAARFFRKKQQD